MNELFKLPYHTAFIVNPTAGGGHAAQVWPEINEFLEDANQRFETYFTEKKGDGTRLAEKAVSGGAELIVAVGGDGTLHEVVNGICPDKTIFGIIPLGTGNGFRRSCGIPGHWREALHGLGVWQKRSVDLGVINGSYFLNVVGIGFDAAVAELASDKYKSIKGYLAYLVAFFEELMAFEHFKIDIAGSVDEWHEKETLLAVVANGAIYGGHFTIAPKAVIDDGKLDLILVRKRNSSETTLLAIQAFAGRHLENSQVVFEQGSRFKIKTDQPVPVHIDGEVIANVPLDIKIAPGALQILAP